jgi:hypothetical protein
MATAWAEAPVASEADLPSGEAADEPTVAAVNATLHEIFACFDAAQYARAFALMTDDAIRQFGPDVNSPEEDTPEEVSALLDAQVAGTPTTDNEAAPSGEHTEVSAPRGARVLDDGRVGAIFESEGDAVFALFARHGDRWLLDGFIDIVESGTPTP